jgi:hypothetical protein
LNSYYFPPIHMPHPSIYELYCTMREDDVLFAYKGEVNEQLLESVYEMMDKHLHGANESPERRKKLYHILIESLQNIFHHQAHMPQGGNEDMSGFVISRKDESSYYIITGNYILNSSVDNLKSRIDSINMLNPEELRKHYQRSLAETELSAKGGAGLGIIELARKSGSPLEYSFTRVNEKLSFFSLAITV